jgi:hypothetical protein
MARCGIILSFVSSSSCLLPPRVIQGGQTRGWGMAFRHALVGLFLLLATLFGASTQSFAWPADYGDQFLKMSDEDLVKAGLNGIAYCRLIEGYPGAPCHYYMRLNAVPWPEGTGCTEGRYMYMYGCGDADWVKSAACVLRLAITDRYCF